MCPDLPMPRHDDAAAAVAGSARPRRRTVAPSRAASASIAAASVASTSRASASARAASTSMRAARGRAGSVPRSTQSSRCVSVRVYRAMRRATFAQCRARRCRATFERPRDRDAPRSHAAHAACSILVLLARRGRRRRAVPARAPAADPRLSRSSASSSGRTRSAGCRTTPTTRYLAEFGIVFLMFSIGLEFSLPQLRAMRRAVFGLGLAQVAITTVAGDGRAAARRLRLAGRPRARRRARDELDRDRVEDARRAHGARARRTAATSWASCCSRTSPSSRS